jgi:hypothetical protein
MVLYIYIYIYIYIYPKTLGPRRTHPGCLGCRHELLLELGGAQSELWCCAVSSTGDMVVGVAVETGENCTISG